jgi:pimeloyl-ACP methyl ester carboxylesterase
MSSGTTVVLVHGAFTDASSWHRLYAELAGDGLTIAAPPNPLRGLTTDAEYLKRVVEEIDAPVLLVAHGYAGAVITAMGAPDNVVGLVYVAAFAPDIGEDISGLRYSFPAPMARSLFRSAALPDGGEELTIRPDGFHRAFCADLPASEAAFMAIAQRPLSVAALTQKTPAAAWRSRPSWAALPTSDSTIHPDMQRHTYDRIGATVTLIEGASHCVMLSRPSAVAGVVRDALRGYVSRG